MPVAPSYPDPINNTFSIDSTRALKIDVDRPVSRVSAKDNPFMNIKYGTGRNKWPRGFIRPELTLLIISNQGDSFNGNN